MFIFFSKAVLSILLILILILITKVKRPKTILIVLFNKRSQG
jgi:hypothetical protein